MANQINIKFRNSYKDEYDALYEAVFGETETGTDTDTGTDTRTCSGTSSSAGRPAELDAASQDESSSTAYTRQHSINLLHLQHLQLNDHEGHDDYVDSTWSTLPDLLLENIYSYLSTQQRYYCSITCRSWYRSFRLPNAWRIFVFDDKTLTRRIFNYYSGWQYMIDHLRAQLYLANFGQCIKTLIFKPISNFYNLYEFMNMLSFYAEQPDNAQCMTKRIGANVVSLRYTFPCNMATKNETRLYGTGGKLLSALKRLIGNLPSLKNLELIDLMLDSDEALTLLDDVCYSLCLRITKLVLVNISKTQCPLLHVGMFLNLQELIISPQSLGDDVLQLIADTNLRHLHILQTTYTQADLNCVSSKAWLACKQCNRKLRVHLQIQSTKNQTLLWQESAPVSTILLDSPQIKADIDTIVGAVNNYSKTLRLFGHLNLSRYHQSKSFHERIDSHLLDLCNNCPNLQVLIVKDKISTATVLLISYTAKKLKSFFVRKNAVVLRCDWPQNPEWTDDMYQRVKSASRSYELTEQQVSINLGCKWKMLTDKEFKVLRPQVQF